MKPKVNVVYYIDADYADLNKILAVYESREKAEKHANTIKKAFKKIGYSGYISCLSFEVEDQRVLQNIEVDLSDLVKEEDYFLQVVKA